MAEEAKKQPSFSDVYLKEFTANNAHCCVSVEGESLIVDLPWDRDDARLKSTVDDQVFIGDLNNISLSAKYDAVFHNDANRVEFVYSYLDPLAESNKDLIDRNFDVYFEGKKYKCYFAEPTERLLRIAKCFERLPSDTAVKSIPQIIPFKDAQHLEDFNERVRGYFNGKVPRCFFVESDERVTPLVTEGLAKHINFIMSYYDRNSPLIEIKQDPDDGKIKNKKPIRYIEGEFPETLLIQPIDDIVLKLIEVAKTSQARFSFLYYYQVFEYAGYYYIDESAKRSLRNFLKDPALINCGEDKVSELFTIFSDINHNDDVKMKKVISEHCDPVVVWKEIENDKEFFSDEHVFDGGFVLAPLISSDTTENSWKAMWMPKLYDHLTRIRNSLVHARERRENKVILPTRTNNLKLKHYIPLIERMAEQIALKTG